MVRELESIYRETRNEKVMRLLQKMRAKLDVARETEVTFNLMDFEEILRNRGLFPHAVQVWAFDYRDQEIS